MKLKLIILFFLLGVMLTAIIHGNFSTQIFQQYAIQSKSWISGQIGLLYPDAFGQWEDTVKIGDLHYWPLGPFPSVVISVFAIASFQQFPVEMWQGLINILLIVPGISILVFMLARKYGYARTDSLFWSLLVVSSSTLVGPMLIPYSWWLAHGLSVLLLLSAYYLFIFRPQTHLSIIGMLLALSIGTRLTTVFNLGYFILVLLVLPDSIKSKIANLSKLLVPIILVLLVYGLFNYARFGDFLNTGVANVMQVDVANLREMRGTFSLEHIPSNFVYYFLETPQLVLESGTSYIKGLLANNDGMSFFFVGPLFLLLFKSGENIRNRRWKRSYLWIVIGITLLTLLSFFASGRITYGVRYANDFLVPAVLILLSVFSGKVVKKKYYLILLVSSLTNVLLIFGSCGIVFNSQVCG